MFKKDTKVWRTEVYGYSDDLVCVRVDDTLWKELDMYTNVRVKLADGTCLRVRYMNDNPEGTRWVITETKKGTNPGQLRTFRYPLNDVYLSDELPIKVEPVYGEKPKKGTKLTNKIPHAELNSLISVACHNDYNICIGLVTDMHKGGEPRFKVYNCKVACEATGGIEVSLRRPAILAKDDPVCIGCLANAAIHDLVSKRYVIHNYTVFQVLCATWNLINDFITVPVAVPDGWSMLDDWAAGKYDEKNAGVVGYIPSFVKMPDYSTMPLEVIE